MLMTNSAAIHSTETAAASRASLDWRWQVVVFAACSLVVISRRPDAFYNAQFWAEDGKIWYAQAYNLGWLHALTLPFGSYLNTLSRLAAALALCFPFRLAPLIMDCVGLVCQVLPVCVLLSSRCTNWGGLGMRGLMATVYVAIPNSWEVDVNATDAHFHLALVAFLVATGVRPASWTWKFFDTVVCLLVGLTGPWSIVLWALIAIVWWFRRDRWYAILAGLLAFCGLVQALFLVATTGEAARMSPHLGASFRLLLKILGGNVFVAAILGQDSGGVAHSVLITGPIALAGLLFLGFTFWKSRLELRLFLAFSAALLIAALSRPIIVTPGSQWRALLYVQGARYWFYPMLAFLWSLSWWCFKRSSRIVRVACTAVLACMSIGVVRDWRYKPYVDLHFQQYAAQFEAAPPGTMMEIPINPVNQDKWVVRLLKK
jgi:hypothetical protein